MTQTAHQYLDIEVETRQTHENKRIIPDTYKLTPTAGWVWVQKICLWMLERLGCNAIETYYTTTSIAIDQQKVLESVREQMTWMRRRGDTPDFILLGESAYDEARQDVFAREFTSHYEGKAHDEMGTYRPLYGVPIRVVTYFKGCVVVPKAK